MLRAAGVEVGLSLRRAGAGTLEDVDTLPPERAVPGRHEDRPRIVDRPGVARDQPLPPGHEVHDAPAEEEEGPGPVDEEPAGLVLQATAARVVHEGEVAPARAPDQVPPAVLGEDLVRLGDREGVTALEVEDPATAHVDPPAALPLVPGLWRSVDVEGDAATVEPALEDPHLTGAPAEDGEGAGVPGDVEADGVAAGLDEGLHGAVPVAQREATGRVPDDEAIAEAHRGLGHEGGRAEERRPVGQRDGEAAHRVPRRRGQPLDVAPGGRRQRAGAAAAAPAIEAGAEEALVLVWLGAAAAVASRGG